MKFLIILFLLSLFPRTFRFSQTCWHGNDKPKEIKFKQNAEFAEKNIQINMTIKDTGHCEVLICYRSQFESIFQENGMKLKNAHKLGTSHPGVSCDGLPAGKWHAILARANPKGQINLSLSISDLSFQTKEDSKHLHLKIGQYQKGNKDFDDPVYNLQANYVPFVEGSEQMLGGFISDFAWIWALKLDMIPLNGSLNLCLKNIKTKGKDVCNRETGLPVEDNCEIEVKFHGHGLDSDDGDKSVISSESPVNSEEEELKPLPLPLTLEHNITLGSNLIVKGRPGEDRDNHLEINFLHGWKTTDNIMGEPIVYVVLRQHIFLNVWTYKKYREDKRFEMDEMVEKSHSINLTANEVFILSVQATIKDGKTGYQIRLNCTEMHFLEHTMPLPYTSVENIHILAKNVEILVAKEIRSLEPPRFPQISESILLEEKLGLSGEWLLVVSAKSTGNPHSFTINFVHYDAEWPDKSEVLMKFKFINGQITFDTNGGNGQTKSNMRELLKPDEDFTWIFFPGNGIFLNQKRLFDNTKAADKAFNYIQFKGGLANVRYKVFNKVSSNKFDKTFHNFTSLKIQGLQCCERGNDVLLLKFFTKSEEDFTMEMRSRGNLTIKNEHRMVVFSMRGVEFKPLVPVDFVLHAGDDSYIVEVQNTTIAHIAFNDMLPSPENIQWVESGQPDFFWIQPHQVVGNPNPLNFTPVPPISKPQLFEQRMLRSEWLSISAKLLSPSDTFTINFLTSAGSLNKLSSLAQFQFIDGQFKLEIKEKSFNLSKDANGLIESGDEFTLIFIPGNGFFVNYKWFFNDLIIWGKSIIDHLHFQGDLVVLEINVYKILPNGLGAPLRMFTDLRIQGRLFLTQRDFLSLDYDEVVLTFICLNKSHCHQTSKSPMFLGALDDAKKGSDFYIRIGRESVKVYSKFGNVSFTTSGIHFKPGATLDLVLHAGPNHYSLQLNGEHVGRIPYYGILPYEHIDWVGSGWINFIFTQPHQIQWNQLPEEKALPFSYKLEKHLERGSRIEIEFVGKTVDIYLLHQAAFYFPEIGSKILHLKFDGQELHLYEFSGAKQSVEFAIQNASTRTFCELLVQHKHYSVFVNHNNNILVSSKQQLTASMASEVQFISTASPSNATAITHVKVTWPSDSEGNWVEPAFNSLSYPQSKSFPLNLFGFKQIEIRGKIKKDSENSIYFLNGCTEWVEQICDVILHINMEYKVEGTISFVLHFYLHKNQKMDQTAQEIKISNSNEFVLKIKYYKWSQIEFDLQLEFSHPWVMAAQLPLPLDSVTNIWVKGFERFDTPKVAYFESPKLPAGFRLHRPLRVGDQIEIKGEMASSHFEISFMHGVLEPIAGAGLIIMDITVNPQGIHFYSEHSGKKILIKDLPIGPIESGKNVEIKITVDNKYFGISFLGLSKHREQSYNFVHKYPFWAVQFIYIADGIVLDSESPKIKPNYMQ